MNYLFLLGCIPMRMLLVYINYILTPEQLKYFALILFLIGVSFIYLYFTNGRLNAPEANGITWWTKLRIIHGVLYIAGSIYAFKGEKINIPLIIDVIFGLIAYLWHYKINLIIN